jgi:Tol biopolymer transport system component/DNA-binding winged helix-turn-helix (wHTH) protein
MDRSTAEQNPGPKKRFGVFEYDPQARELTKHGVRLKLQEQPVQILAALLEQAGQIVPREELQRRLWPDGTFVDYEQSLNKAVNKLREALGDSTANPIYIETLARRGYRFVAPVEVDSPKEAPAQERKPARPHARPWRTAWLRLAAGAGAAILLAAAIGWVLNSTRSGHATAVPSRAIPLTGLPGFVAGPSFSPDGKQIAYAWRDEDSPDDAGIYVKLVGAGTALRLTNAPEDKRPRWSPDGQWIAFWRQVPPGSAIYVISALGGPARRIIALKDKCFGLDWLPDGQRLVVSEGLGTDGYSARLIFVNVDTGQQQPLAPPPAGSISDTWPAVSPDGKTLGFIRWTASGLGSIYLMPIDGGSPRWLASDAETIAWMPDGREIVFSSFEGRLWRIPVTGGAPQAITSSAEHVSSPAVSRQGRRLAFVVGEGRDSLWRIDLSGTNRVAGPPARLENSTRNLWDPSYSPDGSRLVFGSDRAGFGELWVGDAQGRGVQLTRHESYAGSARWSPDGSWISFDSRLNGNADIFVVRPDGGTPRRMTTHPAEDVVPSWSHDGKWIYFMSTRSGEPQIWKVPAETGESPSTPAVQVTQGGGMDAFESTGGKYLYYAKGRGKTGLWRKDLAIPNGREEPVLPSLQYRGWWALAPQGVFFLEQPESPPRAKVRLKFLDLASQRITELTTLEKPVNFTVRGICLSQDGRHLLYTQTDRAGSDVMLVENFH